MAAKKQLGRKKVSPQRTCIVCRQKFDKRQITRVVRTEVEGVVVDLSGKKNGRGAYLCHNRDCWQQAISRNSLDGALRTRLTNDEKQLILDAAPA